MDNELNKKEENNINDPRGGNLSPFAVKPTVKITDALDQVAKRESSTNTVKTFQSDISSTVKTDNVSMIKIALAENERREKSGNLLDVSSPKKSYKGLLVVIFTLVVLAGAVGFVYFYFNKPPAPTLKETIAPKEPELVYSENQVAIDVTSKAPATILQEIKTVSLAKFDLGTIQRVFLTTQNASGTRQSITSSELFSKLKSRAPESLIRSIEPYFIIGAYSFTPHDSFVLFKVKSYDSAYASMLQWEPYMETDIGNMFIYESLTPTENNQASTTITTIDRVAGVFKDKILQNKDTRALILPDGSTKFLYTFLDKQTLLIVSSEKGLKEIIFRTTSGRIIR